MNQPWIYMYFPSQSPLPPPSPPDPSGSSQCTRSKHLSHASKFVLVSGTQQSESVIHIHISTLFFRFFSHIGHYRVLSRVLQAIQYMSLLVICSIYNSVYMPVPVSQFIPSPSCPGNHTFVFYIHDSTSIL